METKPSIEFVENPSAAQWLKEKEQAIVPSWISFVRRTQGSNKQAKSVRPMASAQLIEFFDSITIAVQCGQTSELDTAIQDLVTDRLGQDYSLTDFLSVAFALKSAIWQAAQTSLAKDRISDTLLALEPVFAHSTARLAWLASRAAEARLEEELERTRFTLSQLDRVKSDFISIAAHELKTPLTLIQGYTAILSSELSEQRNLQNVLGGLTNGIRRLGTLIQDMIDVSLIDSSVLTLSLHPASLYEIVRLTINDLEQEATWRRLTIRVRRFPQELNAIHLDAKRMYQVFTNLIGNAIKYTPDDGTITLKARVLQDPKRGLRFVEASVADTGIGIASEDMPHIFDKFYRVGDLDLHSTSKTKFRGGGPGLGLAIAKGIVEAHGGRIWAESPGCDEDSCPGSTFHIMLPLLTEAPESPSERLPGLETD